LFYKERGTNLELKIFKIDSKNSLINIEEQVDKILQNNKEKLEKLNKNESNIEKISLKNKNGDTIYCLRNKSEDNKTINESNFLMNKNVLKEKNSFEKHSYAQENIKESLYKIEAGKESKKNIKIDTNKSNKETPKNFGKADNLRESKDSNNIVSEIKRELNKIQTKGDSKKIEQENSIYFPKFDISKSTKDLRKKSYESNKKPDYLKNKPMQKEKNLDWVSQTTDNLVELKKSETQKPSFDIINKTEEITTKKETKFKSKIEHGFFKHKKVDYEIEPGVFKQKTHNLEKIAVEKKVDTHETKKSIFKFQKKELDSDSVFERKPPDLNKAIIKVDVSETKKHFFGPKKVSGSGSVVEQETPTLDKTVKEPIISKAKKGFFKAKKTEDKSRSNIFDRRIPRTEKVTIKKDVDISETKKSFFRSKKNVSDVNSEIINQRVPEPEKMLIRPVFHVEKITFGEESNREEAKIIDKKIIESKEKSDGNFLKAELETKANVLAKEHLKNIPVKNSLNEEFIKKSEKNLNANITADVKDSGQEHVFFNEEDSPHYGWSSQVIEKEKSKVLVPELSKEEIIIINLSGRGDKDVQHVARIKGIEL